jgi:class I fructose-bisphosphate aldolase
MKFGKTHKKVYDELTPGDHPIELTRYQVVGCYMGRMGLINSGGASGENDLAQAVRTAVINKRAGGMGLISGRKAFQKPLQEGVKLLNTIQDVYLCEDVTVA